MCFQSNPLNNIAREVGWGLVELKDALNRIIKSSKDPKGEMKDGEMKDVNPDPDATGLGWRVLHCAAASIYLLCARALWRADRRARAAMYCLSFLLSIVWSITRYGGPRGKLVLLDCWTAYSVVLSNYHLARSWLFTPSAWSMRHLSGVVICHAAVAVYAGKKTLKERGVEPWIYNGIGHTAWRLMSGYGAYLVVSSSLPRKHLL